MDSITIKFELNADQQKLYSRTLRSFKPGRTDLGTLAIDGSNLLIKMVNSPIDNLWNIGYCLSDCYVERNQDKSSVCFVFTSVHEERKKEMAHKTINFFSTLASLYVGEACAYQFPTTKLLTICFYSGVLDFEQKIKPHCLVWFENSGTLWFKPVE